LIRERAISSFLNAYLINDRSRDIPEADAVHAGNVVTNAVYAATSRARGVRDTVPPMRIGYGRVSTRDQHPEAQHDALRAAGCDPVFIDKASGKLARRPELDNALRTARDGDQLVIT